jgi:hypothetical protein
MLVWGLFEGMVGMMRKLGFAVVALFCLAGAASAQDSAPSIYDYALQHPTADARLPSPPSVGASVPQNVEVHQAEGGNGVYGYFYYEGRPILVDMTTRSIVRVG